MKFVPISSECTWITLFLNSVIFHSRLLMLHFQCQSLPLFCCCFCPPLQTEVIKMCSDAKSVCVRIAQEMETSWPRSFRHTSQWHFQQVITAGTCKMEIITLQLTYSTGQFYHSPLKEQEKLFKHISVWHHHSAPEMQHNLLLLVTSRAQRWWWFTVTSTLQGNVSKYSL